MFPSCRPPDMTIPGPQSEQARRFAELVRSRPSHRRILAVDVQKDSCVTTVFSQKNLTKEFSMTEEQKLIASRAIAQVVTEIAQGLETPQPEVLKTLAIAAAEALVEAFAKLDGEDRPVITQADVKRDSISPFELDLFNLLCDWSGEGDIPLADKAPIAIASQVRKTCVVELNEVLRRYGLFPGVHQKAPAA
jgi:uncharacterized metal-binding protein